MEKVVGSVSLALPVGEAGSGHVGRHVAAQLSGLQGQGLKRLAAALQAQGAELLPKAGRDRGRRVETGADAVRWVLENYELAVKDEG